uniref:Ig-like domain-containing protein n=1 Tax=Pundamilia nyererei TaxID=303518 RepID=A0A3B4GFH6_9CICH
SVFSVIPAGGSVTLSCSVEGSAGWKFDWFRHDSQFSGAQKIGAGTSKHTISISEGGIYYCIGRRGDPVFYTEYSAAVTIQKQREGEIVLKFSEDGRLYSDCRRMTGSTCDINTSKSDTAVYWCESGSGEFSSAVNITVQNDGNGPILVSPVHPVTEGASVSLSCSLRTQKILSNVFFYHNDKLIENDPRGELKISAVSKSDEGFYKCQYSGRESAQSWITSLSGFEVLSSIVLILDDICLCSPKAPNRLGLPLTACIPLLLLSVLLKCQTCSIDPIRNY